MTGVQTCALPDLALLTVNMFTKNEGKRLFITLYIKHAVCNVLILKTVKIPNLIKK